MSKRLIMILTLAFVLGIAFAAYAGVQNVKVSGDIALQGVSRNDLTLRRVGEPTFNEYDRHISGVLSHVRVKIDADLTDNVSTTVRLINERLWGVETNGTSTSGAFDNASSSNVSIDLAYATMKEFLYSPLTLTVGRQELHFGNDLIIGDPDTNNLMAGHATTPLAADTGRFLPRSLDDLTLRKSFDAVRATLNYDPLVIDAVWSKVAEGRVDNKDDHDLYGVNANYAVDKNSTLEGYYWEKKRQKAGVGAVAPQVQESHHDIVRTIGARGDYRGIKNLLVGLEGAFQFGEKVNNATLYPNDVLAADGGYRRRRAYALQFVSQYNLSDVKYNPVLVFTYTHLSGEPLGGRDKTYRGWDPMFENQAGGTLFNKIMGYSNAGLYNAKVSAKPMQDVTLSVDYYYIRLLRAFNDSGVGITAVNLTGVAGDPTYRMVTKKNTLGNEVDAMVTYDYTEDVQFGLGAGLFIPGNAFDDVNKESATQVIGSMKVTF